MGHPQVMRRLDRPASRSAHPAARTAPPHRRLPRAANGSPESLPRPGGATTARRRRNSDSSTQLSRYTPWRVVTPVPRAARAPGGAGHGLAAAGDHHLIAALHRIQQSRQLGLGAWSGVLVVHGGYLEMAQAWLGCVVVRLIRLGQPQAGTVIAPGLTRLRSLERD